MTLRLITGRANGGKTGRIYGAVRTAISNGRGAIVVLPTIPDVQRARDELSREMPLGLKVTTFHGLVTTLWEQWGDGRLLVGEAQRSLVFAALARERGQSRSMGRLAAECASRLVETTGEGWRSSAPEASGAGRELSTLLVAYARHLDGAGLIEPAEATWRLASRAVSHEDLIAVHRFGDFTTSQLALLKGIAAASEVVVTLTWQEGFTPTSALDCIVAELAPHAKVEVAEESALFTDPVLGDLGESLFSGSRQLAGGGESVRFVLAEGREAEARQIADEIRRALSDGKASARDRIAVAFRTPTGHLTQLEHVLGEEGILADFDMPRPFSRTPFGSAFLDLLAFAVRGERAPLLNLLRSPFSGVDQVGARELEQHWRHRGILGPAALVDDVGRVSTSLQWQLRQLRRISTNPLASTDCQLLADAARDLFAAAYGRDETYRSAEAGLDSKAHARIMSLLSEVAAASDLDVLLADVYEALSSSEIVPDQPERPGRVQIMPVTRLRGRRFETVIIAGLNAGEFPAVPAELTLRGSAVDRVLARFGGGGEAAGTEAFEQLLFYEAVTRAKNRLVLSARASDDDGEALMVSPLMEAVGDFYRGEEEAAPLPVHSYRRIGESAKSGHDASPRQRLRCSAGARDVGEPRVATAIRRARKRPGMLSDSAQGVGIDSSTVFTASQIQAYVRCPYRWFYEYRLSPRELEREFGARDEGELAHALLAAAYERLIEQGAVTLSPASLSTAHELVDALHEERVSAGGEADSLERQVGRSHALQWARRVLAEDADRVDGYAPALIEWEFGYEHDPVDMGGYLLRGRVDRIDVDRDGRAIVIDYKRTCGPQHGAAKMLSAGLVQVPLYLEAVRRSTQLTPVAGIYRGLTSPLERGLVMAGAIDSSRTTSTDVFDPEAFEALIDEALLRSLEATEGMRAGVIAPAPITPDSCAGCSAASNCGARR